MTPPSSWEEVRTETGRIILDPGAFYILVSREAVTIPPTHAAEMAPYLAMVGEFRVHYAGFFDPGFGWARSRGWQARGACSRCVVTKHHLHWSTARSWVGSYYEEMASPPVDALRRGHRFQTTRARASSCRSISAAVDRRGMVHSCEGTSFRCERRFPHLSVLFAHFLDDKDIADRSGFGVFQRLLILRRVVAGLRRFERGKSG